jgi:hypothetical protein
VHIFFGIQPVCTLGNRVFLAAKIVFGGLFSAVENFGKNQRK